MTMTLPVFFAVLSAALLHAGWNAVIKVRLDPFLAMTLLCIACGLIALPSLAFTGFARPAAWPWVAGSVVLHFGYYVCLSEAYRRADMSQIYPIARGSAPLLTALVSVTILHETMSAGGIAGVMLLGSGVLLLSLRGRHHSASENRVALAFALLTAVTIAGYTVVDGVGARVAGNPNAYAATLFVFDALPMLTLCLYRYGPAGMAPMRRFLLPGFAGGAMSLAAYWIVIWAMTLAPIPLVAAVRETSVVFAGFIAVYVLKEPFSRVRAAAATLTVAGLALMRIF
ncbi:EamA family transporter [Paraburkholderia sp. HD33-4]|uniref:EamA family transporter n=1 Tax=Paraburkholderia sp. HD33-4 TaxID=2883242 RepID=UPI001F30A8DC|nr:EamA family transporter [Paraburkholderia sp. HD33-4]